MNYSTHLLITFEIALILALSLNLVVGYCGLFSLSHAIFFAIGGYAYAILSLRLGPGQFVISVLCGACMSSMLSMFLAAAAWRLRGDFFALASIAFQCAIFGILYNWSTPNFPPGSWQNLTNGPLGISNLPEATLLGRLVSGPLAVAALSTGVALACAWIMRRITASPWGRLLVCLRDDEVAAQSLGKNTRVAKMQALAISSAAASAAGTVYALYARYVDPSMASLEHSMSIICAIVIGGLGNFRGPIIGSLVLVGLPELLRLLRFDEQQVSSIRMILFGLALIAMMRLRPQGLAGNYRVR